MCQSVTLAFDSNIVFHIIEGYDKKNGGGGGLFFLFQATPLINIQGFWWKLGGARLTLIAWSSSLMGYVALSHANTYVINAFFFLATLYDPTQRESNRVGWVGVRDRSETAILSIVCPAGCNRNETVCFLVYK